MILKGSYVKISDNSGGIIGKCIHVFKSKIYGQIGDLVLVSIKTYNSKKKIKKGEIHLSIIIRVKSSIKTYNRYVKFSDNSVILLNKKLLPLATRLFGVSIHNIRFENRKVYLMLPNII